MHSGEVRRGKERWGTVGPTQAIKAYRGSRGKAPLILNLGTRWRQVVSFTPLPLYLPATHRIQSWTVVTDVVRIGEQKTPLPLLQIVTFSFSKKAWSLCRLSYPGRLSEDAMRKYRVIHKSLRDFRPLRNSSRDGHAEGEHVNRGRYTPKFLSYLTGARYVDF